MVRINTAILTAMLCAPSFAAEYATIYFASGASLVVPDTWEIDVYPKDFNTQPFNFKTNIAGKSPGAFGGWPLYTAICGENDFSPVNPDCEKPYFQAPPSYDFYDINEDGIVDFGAQRGCTYDPLEDVSVRVYNCNTRF